MSEHTSNQESPFANGLDVILTGTPYVFWRLIEIMTTELAFQDWTYEVWLEDDHTLSTRAKFLVRVKKKGARTSDNVGVIMLQLTGDNQTLFHVPPSKQWEIRFYLCDYSWLFFIPRHFGRKSFNKRVDESFFIYFLDKVFTKFQQLGFLSVEQKPPIGFRPPHKEKNV